MTRQSWNEYFLSLAEQVATRATCSSRQVGAVIVKDKRIVATGYNGGPSKLPHCSEGACPRAGKGKPTGQGYNECIAIHAEANAIMFSSPEERENATLYVTTFPCFGCAKLIANSGISEVIVGELWSGYFQVYEFLKEAAIEIELPSLLSLD